MPTYSRMGNGEVHRQYNQVSVLCLPGCPLIVNRSHPHFSCFWHSNGEHIGENKQILSAIPRILIISCKLGNGTGNTCFMYWLHRDCALQFFYVFVLDFLTQNPENLRVANFGWFVLVFLTQMGYKFATSTAQVPRTCYLGHDSPFIAFLLTRWGTPRGIEVSGLSIPAPLTCLPCNS